MEARTSMAPPDPETIKPATEESEIQAVAGDIDRPTRTDTEFGTNCKPLPTTVIEMLPLEDPIAGTTAETTAESNALTLTKDPCKFWTDNFTFKEMPLAYGALDMILESAIHFVNGLMASLTDAAGEESNVPIPRPTTVMETALVVGRLDGKNDEIIKESYDTTLLETPRCNPTETTTRINEPTPSEVRHTIDEPEIHVVETHVVRPILTARATREDTPAFLANTVICTLPELGELA